MAGPSESVRQPAVAGTFYPADQLECRLLAEQYTRGTASGDVPAPGGSSGVEAPATRRANWIGGIVAHAGWICSGALAGQTLAELGKVQNEVDLVVVFGAIHTPIPTHFALLDSYQKWALPGGACVVGAELRQRLLEAAAGAELLGVDDRFHGREHAIEVELPLIRSVWPGAAILPIEVPPIDRAIELGRRTARMVADAGLTCVFLASSDLTHYGPAYGFAPAGVGAAALDWAKQNDRRLLDRILDLREDSIIREVRENRNACGPGAIASMLAACKELGAATASLLRHANSVETLARVAPQPPDNAVGYASLVVG